VGGDETAVGRRVRIVDAREYHQRTNHSPERLRERSFELDYDNQPRPYKLYADVPTVDADWRSNPAETPVLEAVRPASADPPDAAPDHDSDPHLPTLCHYAAGVTKRLERRGQEIEYRAAACTGKLYHVDLYAVAGECGAFDPGVYHFDPDAGAFDVLREGDYRDALAAATGDYPGVVDAPVTFVATSEWWRNA
jgi:hypothetical protein